MRTLSFLAASFALVMGAPGASAQSSIDRLAPVAGSHPVPEGTTEGLLGVSMGATVLDVSSVNDALIPDGYQRLDPTFVTLGVWAGAERSR